jgi:hypothetical protein
MKLLFCKLNKKIIEFFGKSDNRQFPFKTKFSLLNIFSICNSRRDFKAKPGDKRRLFMYIIYSYSMNEII